MHTSAYDDWARGCVEISTADRRKREWCAVRARLARRADSLPFFSNVSCSVRACGPSKWITLLEQVAIRREHAVEHWAESHMSKTNLVVTRGGVSYEVPEPTLRADEVVHSLRIGSARYFFAERVPAAAIANDAPRALGGESLQAHAAVMPRSAARAANVNSRAATARRASAVTSEELTRMWQTLDLSDRDDVRVAALFILLREGLRKNEIVRLNWSDLTDEGGSLQLRVIGAVENGREPRVVRFMEPLQCAVLRRYLALEHSQTQYADSPLFWTLGRHGTCRRVRITSHALSYWVTQLQRRAGIERRLSPHAFRRAWLAEGIELGGDSFP